MTTVTIPNDRALPQLATALDASAMADIFAGELRLHGALRVDGCRIDRVKYRPQRNCTVSYVLSLLDDAHGRVFEQRVAGRFFSGGESARRFTKASTPRVRPSAAGPTLSHRPSLDMLAHWLPNDARIAAMAVLDDDVQLRTRWLPEVVAAVSGGEGRLIHHHAEIVQYVPENRVCACVELEFAVGAEMRTTTVYAKADARARGATTHAAMCALSECAAQRTGCLHTASSILWQADAGLHWQAAVVGQPLLDLHSQVSPTMAARVGAQLAALHATPLLMHPPCDFAALAEAPRRVAALLMNVEHTWEPLLAQVVSALARGLSKLAACPQVTLHGDLHPRNILVDGERLVFIDLDSMVRGPAVLELGAWVADMQYRALLAGAHPASSEPSWRAFLNAYADASGARDAAAALLEWSIAYNLFCKRAYRAVSNLKPGRFEMLPQLLALAASMLRVDVSNANADQAMTA